MKFHIRFAPDILRRLGEELVPHADQGIMELVRNAYDADATNCAITIDQNATAEEVVTIEDDGSGMDLDSISNGWLVVGHSQKVLRRYSPKGRPSVGDKGLGRLAALRLGRVARLRTRPASEPGIEYSIEIDWSKFEQAAVVEDIDLSISRHSTMRGHGSTIELVGLGSPLGERRIEAIARRLLLLTDPFGSRGEFKASLRSPNFERAERILTQGFFDDAKYHLIARLGTDGRGSAEVFDQRGRGVWSTSSLRKARYSTVAAEFELWAFTLNKRQFAPQTGASIAELKQWLERAGGVHVYHRGLRVHPYGDPGYDWLDMNLARVRSPEERASTNNSIGRVIVTDLHSRLKEKTDRVGFVEDEAFQELRSFCTDSLEFLALNRLREAEKSRVRRKAEANLRNNKAHSALHAAVETVPVQARGPITDAVREYQRAAADEIQALREDLQLYVTLATVGTTSSVFSHDSSKPLGQITKAAAALSRRQKSMPLPYSEEIREPLDVLNRSIETMRAFTLLPMELLARDKRKFGRQRVLSTIESVARLLAFYLDEASIKLDVAAHDPDTFVKGTAAALEAIWINLITNSVSELTSPGSRSARSISFEVRRVGTLARVCVQDSGRGIRGLPVEDIWLPGRSTTVGGTGLGLTIVRDVVRDLGGVVRAFEAGDLGGAKFEIDLPAARNAHE